MMPFMPSFRASGRSAFVGALFAPTDIAGLKLWLDANDSTTLFQDSGLTTPAAADGDVVGGWKDKSGNANHATQATTANKPLLKLAIQNGKPVVRFDGVNDVLLHPFDNNSQPVTVFAVALRNVGVAGFQTIIQANNPLISARTSNSANWGIWIGAEFFSSYSINGVFRVLCLLIRSGTDFDFVTNGTVETKVGLGFSTGLGRKSIGALENLAEPLAGDIAELLIYNSALSAADRQSVESYLNSKWAIY